METKVPSRKSKDTVCLLVSEAMNVLTVLESTLVL